MHDIHSDIERYHLGKLTPEEMHALEKKALSDPFLADALEGLSTVEPREMEEDLQVLRSGIEGRVGKKKVVPLWGWVTAVAAAFAAIVVVFYFMQSESSEKERLAENGTEAPAITEKRTAVPPALKDSAETTDPVPQASVAPEPSEKPVDTKLSAENARPRQEQPKPVGRDIAPEAEPPTSLPAFPNLPVEMASAESEINEIGADSSALVIMERSVREEKSPMVLRGTVVDSEDGRALPGVNVTIPGTSIGAVTDEEGKYEIPVDSLEAGLVFSFIGYETKTLDGGASELNVALEPDVSQLSEVVVVGYGVSNGSINDGRPMVEPATPDGGKKAFKEYLEKNLKYPEQALNRKIEGRVTVQFTVESTGSVSNFTILKGLGFGCEEEVIRLIRSGPKWRPTRKNTAPVADKVKVRMRFTLPKK